MITSNSKKIHSPFQKSNFIALKDRKNFSGEGIYHGGSLWVHEGSTYFFGSSVFYWPEIFFVALYDLRMRTILANGRLLNDTSEFLTNDLVLTSPKASIKLHKIIPVILIQKCTFSDIFSSKKLVHRRFEVRTNNLQMN